MKRLIEQDLEKWKNSKDRMPLLLVGARQTGKTHTVMEFGKKNYADTAMFNFEAGNSLKSIFDGDLEPKKIIRELERHSGRSIIPNETLLFFDEIQACGRAITSLKYFCEQAPEYHIIGAGSLLDSYLVREKTSFPVGKVNLLTMYPMTFREFLEEINPFAIPLIEESFRENRNDPENDRMMELYRTFLFTGGMPKAISKWKETKDPDLVRMIQHEVLTTYLGDMGKYAPASERVKTEAVYDSLPAQLAKENTKFQYSVIGSRARAVSYGDSMKWLISAGLVLQCQRATEGEMPLAAFVDLNSYKAYMSDVGLLNAKSDIPYNMITSRTHGISGGPKGAMAENYVMQELTANGFTPYYWGIHGKAEVDFLIQDGKGKIIPIETKAADNVMAKGLREYVKIYSPEYSIRISSKNFGFDNDIKSVPLYAVWCIER
ncbi:MAG: ATP-binding protein [Candidatus Methanoplasma sp.]|jgi:predicted AAA+ superfamily ATPase|nr:ATP-binding protein [Candidatus Methanoplasma sp.]